MIVDERLTNYIISLEKDGLRELEELRSRAEAGDVPIIRRESESVLRVFLKMLTCCEPAKAPEQEGGPETGCRIPAILEIGTAVGYSALVMEYALNGYCHITTIENYEPRIKEAEKNLSGHDAICLLKGDGAEIIKELEEPFDFIFLDAAKAQYITMLPDLLRLLKKGGVLFADNVLQEGELIESRYITPRRQRTIHERMREFLYEIKHNEQLETCILTIGDGISVSIKK